VGGYGGEAVQMLLVMWVVGGLGGSGVLGTGEVFVEVWGGLSVFAGVQSVAALHTCSTDTDKSRLYPHLSLQQLLRRRRNIVFNPDILFAVVSRGTHLDCCVGGR
jgi:hypothetical protein